jgi:hypothetical protein
MTSKPPTPQGISRLLKSAGFKRSTPDPWRHESGYRVTKAHGRDGAVSVRHVFLTMGVSGEHHRAKLDTYAKTITEAGWQVEARTYELVVTAPKEG